MVAAETEKYVLLADVPSLVPGRPHRATITRWINTGIVGPSGERVRLRSTRVGGRVMVHVDDLARFLDRCNAPREDDETPADVTRRGREAGQALEAMGF